MTDVFKISGEERDESIANLYSSIREILVMHDELLDKWHELSETHKEITKIEIDDNRTGRNIFNDDERYFACKVFDMKYDNIMQSVEKLNCSSGSDPELDRYLYLMMDWSWCNREDSRYSNDIDESELYHWFDSINTVEERKKDILTKLDKMPTYLKQAMTPIANFIISSLDIIIKLAKENCANKNDYQKLTDEYVEKLADYAYVFYYTYNNLHL